MVWNCKRAVTKVLDEGGAWSAPRISETAGVARSRVHAALFSLIQAGEVDRVPGVNGRMFYRRRPVGAR